MVMLVIFRTGLREKKKKAGNHLSDNVEHGVPVQG